MVTKLLHHEPGTQGEVSPFDEAILEVAKGGSLRIICPYIAMPYLQRILRGVISWKIISDIEAWLSSMSELNRGEAEKFIENNLERVRHLKAVHAKVVMSDDKAYFGSANLTSAGILGRTEVGLLTADSSMVASLQSWFDNLWLGAAEVKPGEVKRYVAQINAQSNAIAALALQKPDELQTGNIIVRSRLAVQETAHAATSVKEWLEQYILSSSVQPFSLDDLLNAVPDSEAKVATQEISMLCGNFYDTVYNREVLRHLLEVGGKYRKASPQEMRSALTSFDRILLSVIVALDFDNPKIIPKFDEDFGLNFPQEKGLDYLLQCILNSGMALESKAHDGLFYLNEDWEWPPAFQPFMHSSHLWYKKLDGRKVVHGPSVSRIPSTLQKIASTDFESNHENGREDEAVQSDTSTATRTTSQASTTPEQRQLPKRSDLTSLHSSGSEKSLERTTSDYDHIYLALVSMMKAMGNPLKISRTKLIEKLSKNSSLPHSEITRLLAGNIPNAPTPLIVRDAIAGRRWLNVQEGSLAELELMHLPETRAAWNNIPGIASSRPNLKRLAMRVAPTERTHKSPPLMQRADIAYLEILRKIESIPLQVIFKKHLDLVHHIAQGTPTHPGLVRLLLLGKVPDCPRLFYLRLEKSKVGFKLNPAIARYYPSVERELSEKSHSHPWINPYDSQILFQAPDGKGENSTPSHQAIENTPKKAKRPAPVKKSKLSKKNMAHLIRIADECFSKLVKIAVAHGNPIKRNENSDALVQANKELTEVLIKIRRIDIISNGNIPKIIKIEIAEVEDSPLQVLYDKKHASKLISFPKTKHALNHGYFILKRKDSP